MGGHAIEVTQYACDIRGPEFAEYEYPPTTTTLIKFDDGRTGKVTSCIAVRQPYEFRIHLVGHHGAIRNNQVFSTKKYPGQTSWTTIPTILPDSGDVTHHPFSGEASHLLDCIEQGIDSHADIADAYVTHEIVLAADESGRTGKPVSLPLP